MIVEERQATQSDYLFAKATHHEAYRDVVTRQFGAWDPVAQDDFFDSEWNPRQTTMLIADGELCGYCVIEHRADDVHVRELVIHPTAQRRGVGTTVLHGAQERARACGVPVRLGTFHSNRARELYERLGFRVLSKTANHVLMEWRPSPTTEA